MFGLTQGQGTEAAVGALKHLATAFVFLILGLALLFINSGEIAEHGLRGTKVVAGFHFITLGWLSLSIFGALQVFSGVALGGLPLNQRFSPYARWAWSVGIVFFVCGLYHTQVYLLIPGLLMLGVALALYTIQILPVLITANRGQTTRVFISLAFISLWSAWLLGVCAGLLRVGAFPSGYLIPAGYFHAHLLLASFGWVGSMVIGVGSHLIPMFALSRNTPTLPLNVALSAWFILVPSAIASAFDPHPWRQVAWIAAALGTVAWVVQFVLYLRARIRREKDEGLRIASVATLFLLVIWIGIGKELDPVVLTVLMIIGWLSIFTLGVYHRVVPFLVWFMKYSRPQKGKVPPRVKDLLDARLGIATLVLFLGGLLIWSVGLVSHLSVLLFLGSGAFVVGSLCCLLQIKTLLNPKKREVPPYGAGTVGRTHYSKT